MRFPAEREKSEIAGGNASVTQEVVMALVRFNRRQPRTALPPFPAVGTFPALPSFDDFENRMNKMIERVFTDPFTAVTLTEPIGWVPAIDIAESEKEFTVTAELPGIDEKNVDVSVEEGLLTIKGEKTEEKEEKKDGAGEKKFYLYERNYGSFSRSFALPPNVDATKIHAEFQKGLLKVHLPKTAEAKSNGRKVEIKTT
jgi:HSP20 family protein